jgi:tRNA (cytidine/uridine-2'-O-)-methyltransferase
MPQKCERKPIRNGGSADSAEGYNAITGDTQTACRSAGEPAASMPNPLELRAKSCAMRLALFEPDIPQNTGAMLRLAACLGVGVDVIEPCGFVWSDRHLRRAGMDYLDLVEVTRHASWPAFVSARGSERLILLTTRAERSHVDIEFRPRDVLIVGRESAGVPQAVHEAAHVRVCVPMAPEVRSLNVAMAAAIVLGEALRQTGQLPAGALAAAS